MAPAEPIQGLPEGTMNPALEATTGLVAEAAIDGTVLITGDRLEDRRASGLDRARAWSERLSDTTVPSGWSLWAYQLAVFALAVVLIGTLLSLSALVILDDYGVPAIGEDSALMVPRAARANDAPWPVCPMPPTEGFTSDPFSGMPDAGMPDGDLALRTCDP